MGFQNIKQRAGALRYPAAQVEFLRKCSLNRELYSAVQAWTEAFTEVCYSLRYQTLQQQQQQRQ